MKTKIFLLIVLIGISVLINCTKTERVTIPKKVQHNFNIENLKKFHKMITSKLKDDKGDTISLDSAVISLEADINYTYDVLDTPFSKTFVDTSYFAVNLYGNQQVKIADLPDIYDMMVLDMKNNYKNLEGRNKQFVVLDIEPIDIQENSATFQNIMYIGYGPAYPNYLVPFTEEDNWEWGNELGRCGCGTNCTSDASDEILARILGVGIYMSDYYEFFTYVTTAQYAAQQSYQYNNPLTNYEDYQMFFGQNHQSGPPYYTFDGCILYDAMNFYLTRTRDYLNFVHQNYWNTMDYGIIALLDRVCL